jgi:hypothetical protein
MDISTKENNQETQYMEIDFESLYPTILKRNNYNSNVIIHKYGYSEVFSPQFEHECQHMEIDFNELYPKINN